MEENRTVLNDRNVAHNSKVVEGSGISEEDRILTIDHEAGNVEGSKVHNRVLVGLEVTGAREVVEACGNVHNQLPVDQDIKLPHTVVEIVQ